MIKSSAPKHRDSRKDIREMPAYTIAEVAHYLDVPPATIRYWSLGQHHHKSLVTIPKKDRTALLSFFNFAEMHILAAIRRRHKIAMSGVRKTLRYLVNQGFSPAEKKHPLISHSLFTDGIDLFVKEYGAMINASREGQIEMRETIRDALERIERGRDSTPVTFYPFTRSSERDSPKVIIINPYISAGHPIIEGTGITTQAVAQRYKAGESINELMNDYNCEAEKIEEAIRCEFKMAA